VVGWGDYGRGRNDSGIARSCLLSMLFHTLGTLLYFLARFLGGLLGCLTDLVCSFGRAVTGIFYCRPGLICGLARGGGSDLGCFFRFCTHRISCFFRALGGLLSGLPGGMGGILSRFFQCLLPRPEPRPGGRRSYRASEPSPQQPKVSQPSPWRAQRPYPT